MDGTLLDSRKEILPGTVEAIDRAAAAGKTVCLSTGRALSEILPYRDQLKRVRYAVTISGAYIYDFEEKKAVSRTSLTKEETDLILQATAGRDVMVQPLGDGEALLSERHYKNLAHYHMEPYQKLYDETAVLVEDTRTVLEAGQRLFEKVNLDHTDPEEREVTRRRLENQGLVLADAEISNLEVSPKGISKGVGLKVLGDLLGISTEEMIAVGDAENDRIMLETVGFPIAMGNAADSIKEICRAVVADNDHDGCAEAITTYLLGEEAACGH